MVKNVHVVTLKVNMMRKENPKIDNMTQNYRYLIPPAYAIEEIFRTNYKVCHCKNFNPKKKGWEF
jgi:hypothetical protein